MDRELREAQRRAQTGAWDDIGEYIKVLRRHGMRLCNCESVVCGHPHPCLTPANLLTKTVAGPLCDECIEKIPTVFHDSSCQCDKCKITFYHVALTSDEPRILQEGLLPQIGPRAMFAGETEPRIYLFSNEQELDNALFNWFGEILPEDEGLTIFRIEMPSYISVYPTFEGAESWEGYTTEPIPASYLSVYRTEPPLRHNPDENLRRLEREMLQGDFEAFLRYRTALARSGHIDTLQLKKGMFAISMHGGLNYIKSAGKINVTTVIPPTSSSGSKRWEEYVHGKTKGKGFVEPRSSFLDYNVLIPPELADHMEQIRKEHYLNWATDPDDERPGKKYWVTHYPIYQEELYYKLVNTLEALGYFQPYHWSDIMCSICGRNMGVATPARRLKNLCFYCWADRFNLGEEWLREQLEKNKGYRPQT